jgi:hypothetical protein
MDLIHLLIIVIILAIVWVVIERLLLPLIPDPTISWVIRLVFAVIVLLWLLSFIFPRTLNWGA